MLDQRKGIVTRFDVNSVEKELEKGDQTVSSLLT